MKIIFFFIKYNNKHMQVYLVGGAVRDQILGVPISDYDWVVVGATINDLLYLGFKSVGKDFPVFLHPITGDEYALARIERKISIGHNGFKYNVSSDVNINDDLYRRDITINAIARTLDGNIIDPCNGQYDIKHYTIRHISKSFIEDPLRIFRVARFSAKLFNKKFIIANETKKLMSTIVYNGEITALSVERIWDETKKALYTSSPEYYFYVLYDCGALSVIFPEIHKLFKNAIVFNKSYLMNNVNKYYSFLILKKGCLLSNNIDIRFAALCCEFNNLLNTSTFWLYSHECVTFVIDIIEKFCNRLHVPKKLKELVILSIRFSHELYCINKFVPSNLIDVLDRLNIWRNFNIIDKLITIFMVIVDDTINDRLLNYVKNNFFLESLKIIKNISAKHLLNNLDNPMAIKNELKKLRINKLTKLLCENKILF
uniref:CCA-adding enzyme n=1 Tax=Candidatus Aschnera chinzeii TaxID=1485666 RepID=A0AAT9G4D8_9ENTR|nr:MAG: multifunctional CCA addition/repair protein [Candidatus Aschnera chinzeii]